MKRQIIALTLAIITIFTCCSFTTAETQPEISIEASIIEAIEIKTEADSSFEVERLEEFEDPNLFTYDIIQLQTLIEKERTDQKVAHELAESARKLGWPEGSASIESAKAEWWNSQLAIEIYNTRYNELYAESEEAKWAKKAAEYPVATQIWCYMKDLGWNDYVCAGIMGNIMSEVGGSTLNLKPTLYSYGNKYYYGICQWNKSAYGKIHGADLITQLDFLRDTIQKEMDTYGYAFKKDFNLKSFLNLTNERDAALAFAKCYERCAKSGYTARQNNAEKAYDYFVNN